MDVRVNVVEVGRCLLNTTTFCVCVWGGGYPDSQGTGVTTSENISVHSLKRLNVHNFVRVWRKNTPSFYKLVLI